MGSVPDRPLHTAGMLARRGEGRSALGAGPLQVMLIGFEQPDFRGRVIDELEALARDGIIAIVDRAVVYRDEDGDIHRMDAAETDIGEIAALTDSLLATGDSDWADEQVERHAGVLPEGGWFLRARIPKGTAAALLIIEHRWAREFRNAVIDAGGYHLADTWIHAVDLEQSGYRVPGP